MPRAPWQKLKWIFQAYDEEGNLGTEQEIGQIKRISGTKGSSQRIDVTALDDDKRKYTKGLPEKGEIALELITQSTGLPSPGVNVGDLGKCKLQYLPSSSGQSPSTLLEFDCLVTGVDVNVSVGDAPTLTVKFSAVRRI